MKSQDKTQEQLLEELEKMGRRISELQESETGLRELESALRESDQRFRLLYENAPLAYQSLDENGHFLEVNPAWLDMLGYSRDEVIGHWCGDFLTAPYREKFKVYFPQFKDAGKIHDVEFEMVRKDGSTIFVNADGKIGRDRQGQFKQTHCILRDVTERKTAKESIERANKEWERTFDAISDLVMVLDEQHRILRINKAMAAALGMTTQELIGRFCFELVHGEQTPPDFCPHAQLLADGAEHSAEVVEPRLGGTYDVRVSPLTDQSGQVVGSVHVTRDVTDRKRAENIMLARLRLVDYATSHSLEELLQATLDEVEALTDSSIGFYHFLEADQRTLWLQAWSTRTLRGPCTAEGKGRHYDIDEAGVWVDCVHERKPVIHNDYTALPHRKGMPPGHANVVRELVVPVFRGERIVAVLGVGNKPVDYRETDIETVSLLADLAWDISERKRAEETLRESEAFYRNIYENISDCIFITDVTPDNRFKFVSFNPAEEKAVGMSSEEVAHKFTDDILSRDLAEHVNSRYRMCVERREVIQYEEVLDLPKGKISFSTSLVPIEGPDGKICRIVGVARDITAIKETERQLQTLVENLPDIIARFDQEGRYVYASPTLERAAGVPAQEFIGKIPGRIALERGSPANTESAEFVQETARHVWKTGVAKDIEIVWPLLDGDHVFELRLVPEESAPGKVIGVLGIARDITERKQAQRELQQSNDLLRAIIEAAPTAIIGLDLDGNVQTVWNPAAEKMLGWSAEEAMGHPLPSVSVESQEEFRAFRERIRSGMTLEGVEVRRQRRDGTPIDYSIYASPLHDITGRITGNIAVLVDITERKLAEENLRFSEAKFLDLYENAPCAYFSVGTDAVISLCNLRASELLGYSREELIGKRVFELYADNPEGKAKAAKAFERFLAGEPIADEELQMQKADGSPVWISLTVNGIRDSSGDLLESRSMVLDISDRRQAEERNLWLAAIVESSDDAIIGKTLDGIVTSWNKGAANIYGYQDSEVVGKPVTLLAPPDRHGEAPRLIERAKRGEHVEHYETVRRRKDGRHIDVSLTISLIRNAEGRIIGASTIAREITEQKSLQRQLLQAQKMEAIGTLSGGIAHDFNNLLQVVQGYSELLLMRMKGEPKGSAAIQAINLAAHRGADLVKQILTFSRKVETEFRPIDLNQVVKDTEKLLRRTIPKMIEINLLLGEDLNAINADSAQMQQILMNFAVNAKDAMPNGGKLTIETTKVLLDEEYCKMHLGAKPGDNIQLSVSDTGHGMDNETLQHIFEPFYTTKATGEGTGLGLAMVYGIVKQHGGYVTCYSEPGVGTTFKVYIPALMVEGMESENLNQRPMPKGGTETILLIDDEELIRGLGESILTEAGYRVITARDGKKALNQYMKKRDDISLVILDLIMPEMGGKACLEELLNFDSRVKVLIASGFTADGEAKEAVEAGAKGFIRKPYDMRQMLQAVRDVLDSD